MSLGYAYNIVGNVSLKSLQYNIVERAAKCFNICCTFMLENMFDRNQNIFPTKNMHATHSNIVDPTKKCFITMFYNNVAGALPMHVQYRPQE